MLSQKVRMKAISGRSGIKDNNIPESVNKNNTKLKYIFVLV